MEPEHEKLIRVHEHCATEVAKVQAVLDERNAVKEIILSSLADNLQETMTTVLSTEITSGFKEQVAQIIKNDLKEELLQAVKPQTKNFITQELFYSLHTSISVLVIIFF